MSKKDLALKQALDQIKSSFGKESIMWLGQSNSPINFPVVSTGSFALDMALETGGFPKVATLVPKGEVDGKMGDAHVEMQARLMSQALRKINHSLSLSQTVLIFVNQV
ncbi:hypothetical protein V6N13_006323 [Hibiscus sabdariffa]|uniref:RecA-like N-terminal domain-containing protein n=1 Tax=Hibiscus sabdariffa TaxID=183260 RepID=A0ABR2EN93_9ROSI